MQHVNKSEREAKLFQTTIHQLLVDAADGLVEANFAIAESEADIVVAVTVISVRVVNSMKLSSASSESAWEEAEVGPVSTLLDTHNEV